MTKYGTYILLTWTILFFTFSTPEKVFSQASQIESKTDTAASVTTVSDNSTPAVRGITAGRARSLAGGVLGLTSLILGWRARVRSANRNAGGRGAIAGLLLGLISIVLSVLHLSNSMGAVFGSGSGKAGAI